MVRGPLPTKEPETEAITMTQEPVELVRRFVEGYNNRSLHDDAEAIFASDLVVINEAAGLETQGCDAFLQHAVDGWIHAVPDARVELLDYQVQGGVITVTMQSSGTFDGTLETPEGSIPGTGKPFEMEMHVEATVEGARIVRWVSEYDVEGWQKQVGLA